MTGLKSNFFVNGLAIVLYVGCAYLIWVFLSLVEFGTFYCG